LPIQIPIVGNEGTQLVHIAAGFLCCLLNAAVETEVILDRPIPPRIVSTKLEKTLNQTFSPSWNNVELRTILKSISQASRIAILLDRRIDPTVILAVDFNNQTIRTGLEEIAERVSAGATVAGNTVMIGPPESMAKLRTLVKLRFDELSDKSLKMPKRRRFNLSRRRTIHWNDLDRPRDLIQQIAARYRLEIRGLEKVPHDLWAAATLPKVNCGEALSLILIQFDLSFAWTERAAGIEIVPVPRHVAIEKAYQPRGKTAKAAMRQWQRFIKGLQAEVKGGRVIVRGTVEQHEAVRNLLKPSRKRKRLKAASRPIPPFTKARFIRIPANVILKTLQSDGIIVKYDAKLLDAAGIDLNQQITVDVKRVTADELFQAICDPLGLKFSIDDMTVTLTPK
jgi:hypothetical protein